MVIILFLVNRDTINTQRQETDFLHGNIHISFKLFTYISLFFIKNISELLNTD
jgi:hypothetical protein